MLLVVPPARRRELMAGLAPVVSAFRQVRFKPCLFFFGPLVVGIAANDYIARQGPGNDFLRSVGMPKFYLLQNQLLRCGIECDLHGQSIRPYMGAPISFPAPR